MGKSGIVLAGALGLILLVAWLDSRAPAVQGRVVAVHDGDSLSVVLDGEPTKVRIFGVDAPELRQPWSRRARRALEALVEDHEVRVVEVDRDAYGRLVADVFAGDVCVGCELVRDGHAWVYRQFTDDRTLLRLESEARESATGLWSLPESERIPPWEWRKKVLTKIFRIILWVLPPWSD